MASDIQIWNRAAIAAGETQPISSKQDTAQAAVLLSFLYDDIVRELLATHPWSWAKAQTKLVAIGEQSVDYIGDGGTVEYVIPYDNSDASQVVVTVAGNEKTVGVDWMYTEPTDGYQGKVTFAVAPGAALAVKITVKCERTGWDFVYAVPANCVTPLALLGEGQRQSMITNLNERVPFEVMLGNGDNLIICTNDDTFKVLEYTRLVRNAALFSPHFVEALVCRLAAPLIQAIPKKPRDSAAKMQEYYATLEVAKMVDNESLGQQENPPSPSEVARW